MTGLKLEVFEAREPLADQPVIADPDYLEEQKLAAYEKGYAAGWEDARDADRGSDRDLQAAVSRNLQTLAFSQQEMRATLIRSLRPLIEAMTDALLPDLAREAVGAFVVDEVMKLSEQALDQPLTLFVHPASRDMVGATLQAAAGLSFDLRDEPSLLPEQVLIHRATEERLIDLAEPLTRIRDMARAFFHNDTKEPEHD